MLKKIPQSFIADLLAKVDLVELIGRFIKLKRNGKNYSTCCPFHEEKTPSFVVSPEKQFYYCFGCSAHGNALNFLMDHQHLNFIEAVEDLAKQTGTQIPYEQTEIKQQLNHAKLNNLYELLQQANQYFQQQLKTPEAKTARIYLQKRGLSPNTIERFQIGWAPNKWQHFLQTLNHNQYTWAEQAGLAVAKNNQNYYERFRARITFPIHDPRGRVIAFGGRVLDDQQKPKYLNSPETELFHKQKVLYGQHEWLTSSGPKQSAILVEGYLDVITLSQNTIPNVLATLGTSTSPDHLHNLFRQVNTLYFCFDGDVAGTKAALRALETSLSFMQEGRQINFLFLPEQQDPDTLVRNQGPGSFLKKLSRAKPLSEFLLETLCQDLNLSHIDARARLVELAKNYYTKIPAGVYRTLLLELLSEKVKIKPEQLEPSLLQTTQPYQTKSTRYTFPQSQYKKTALPRHQAQAPYQKLQQRPPIPIIDNMIGMILQNPNLAQTANFSNNIRSAQIQQKDSLINLVELLQAKPSLSLAYLLGHWHNTSTGNYLAKLAAHKFILDQSQKDLEFSDAMKQLEQHALESILDKELLTTPPNSNKVQSLLTQISSNKAKLTIESKTSPNEIT